MATAKHLAANNQEHDRAFTRSPMPSSARRRTLREIYLQGVESTVKDAGVVAVMGACNKVNGAYACENPSPDERPTRTQGADRSFVPPHGNYLRTDDSRPLSIGYDSWDLHKAYSNSRGGVEPRRAKPRRFIFCVNLIGLPDDYSTAWLCRTILPCPVLRSILPSCSRRFKALRIVVRLT